MDRSPYHGIPPMRALKAFEAAARHLSFTRAAEELCVTQAAVSQQIRHLEDMLGAPLFKRMHRKLMLTEDGQKFLPDVREALDILARATRSIHPTVDPSTLTISVLPSFASKWLVPRLWKFHEQHPEIHIHVSAFDWLVDFDNNEADLAIRSGRGSWPGLVAHPLLSEDVFPVCSPELLQGEHPLDRVENLKYHTLLHDDFSREDWFVWLKAVGVEHPDPRGGLTYSHTSLMLDAAIRGHGVALGRTPLVAEDLREGRLIRPFDFSLPADFAYYLVYPERKARHPAIIAFRNWILQEASREENNRLANPTQPA